MKTDANSILNKQIVNKYKSVALEMMQDYMPHIPLSEIELAINYSITKRMKNGKAYIKNNYKKMQVDTTVLDLAEYIISREPIITAYGVMFKKHDEADNPLTKMVQKFLANRKVYKNEMFKYPKGSELYSKYNLLQLLAKIDANGFYGAIGNSSCVFYNVNVAASVTSQGQSSISAAAMAFESFLANNVLFRSLNEVITFIHNVKNETITFNDIDILDHDIDMYSCFEHIILTCGHGYTPSEDDMDIVWRLLIQQKQSTINRLFYKNNLFAFMENNSMSKAVISLLQTLNVPYLDPNSAPKEIEAELDMCWDILREYVFYNHGIIDRIDRLKYLPRKVTMVIDTDSNMICLDPWYKYILDKVYDVPMKIKTEIIDVISFGNIDEFGDGDLISPIEFIEPDYEYNFYTDEVVEIERLINPMVIIPQDGLRFSIINIMSYWLGKMINEVMVKYTKYNHSWAEGKKCYLSMKNEFLFKRMMLTDAKKNYAAVIELQEGNFVDASESLEVKGLSIRKSTLNEKSQKQFQKILYEDILNSPSVNQVTVLKKMVMMEKEIYNSLRSGKKEYYKPSNSKSIDRYDNPMGQASVKAVVAWNALRDNGLEAFDIYKKNSFDIIKVDINSKNIERLLPDNKDLYDRITRLMKSDKVYNAGITAIAIPLDVETPEWILEYIDYKTIISDILTNFSNPLASIGLMMTNKTNVNYSNILQI